MNKINILIANDSQVLMALLCAIVETESNFVIAGTAQDGKQAVQMAANLLPDLILMDIHMPRMNGVEAVKIIMETRPKTKILITSATINRNMSLIFDALKYGAIDYLRTPSLNKPPGTRIDIKTLKRVGAGLLKKINTVLQIQNYKQIKIQQKEITNTIIHKYNDPVKIKRSPMIAIGCSTGGPTTLVLLLNSLSKPVSGPIIICQHIDPGFDENFASWLEQETGFKTIIPDSRTKIYPNCIYIAPAGRNLIIEDKGFYIERPLPDQIYTPNINKTFKSIAKVCSSSVCGIILTGMGDDGAQGLKEIKDNGGYVLVQNDETAIVESMPLSARKLSCIANGYSPESLGLLAGEWIKKKYKNGNF